MSWVQALNISEANFQQWKQSLPKNTNLAFWCLKSKKIDAHAYMNWAQEEYSLAILNDQFFSQPPNIKFWSKIKTVANWSEEMIPICEWDGVVFVACVEPPENIKWSFPVQYLLASPGNLMRYWSSINTTETAPTPTQQKPVAAQQMPVAAQLEDAIPQIQIVSEPEPVAPPKPAPVVSSAPPQQVASSIDSPIGLNLSNFAKSNENKSVDFMDQLAKTVKTSTKNIDLNAPENLTWTPSEKPTTADLAPAGMIINSPTAQVPRVEEISLPNSEKADGLTINLPEFAPDHFNLSQSKIIANVPEAPALPVLPEQIEEPIEAKEPKIPTIPPVILKPPQLSDVPPMTNQELREQVVTPQIPTATIKVDQVPTALADFANFIKLEFKGGMLIEVKGDQFVPLVWDENFNPANPRALTRWSLSSGSAFRITFRTKMPYLGHIVQTPTNSEFFAAWGFSKMPDSILIQPVIVDNNLKYMVLALCEPGKKNHILLTSGEKLAREVNARLSARAAS